MRLLLLAVGTRMPRWVEEAFTDYAARMPRHLPLELTEVRPEPRTTGKPVSALLDAEATRLRAALIKVRAVGKEREEMKRMAEAAGSAAAVSTTARSIRAST